MGTLALRNIIVWFGLDCMYDVWELDGILYEENGNIISNNIPISFFCVELHSEPTHISHRILGKV